MASSNVVSIGPLRLANDRPLALIAGPCVIESEELTLRVAKSLKETAAKLRIPFIFKCSYDKANRSSIGSYRGVGVREGLEILARVKREVGVPVLTDIHAMEDIAPVAAVVDVLQIPAFLCRQTDLVVGAIKSGRVVNVKKGQFLSPWEAANIVEKARAAGGERLMLTERGATFGYNNLVVDMRSLEVMKGHGVPVVFDATHSVQLPGGLGGSSGGNREFIRPLARAAAAIGIDVLFAEVHPNPDQAWSDGPNSLNFNDIRTVLAEVKAIHALCRPEA